MDSQCVKLGIAGREVDSGPHSAALIFGFERDQIGMRPTIQPEVSHRGRAASGGLAGVVIGAFDTREQPLAPLGSPQGLT